MDDQAPIMRTIVRSQPIAPLQRDSLGRTIWRGTARFIGFMGTVTLPVAQAWNMAGGPGGQGGIVMANFLQKFGSPVMLDYNRTVNVPLQSAPYNPAVVQAFLQNTNGVQISTEASDSLQRVLSARYDATMSSVQQFPNY